MGFLFVVFVLFEICWSRPVTINNDEWSMFGHDAAHSFRSGLLGPNTNKTFFKFYISGATRSAAIGSDGTIYCDSLDGNLYAVEPFGNLKWTFKASKPFISVPALAVDGTIYITSQENLLYAINPTGVEQWNFSIATSINNQIQPSPTIGSDGTIFIGSTELDSSYMYAITPSGQLKWKFRSGRSGLICQSRRRWHTLFWFYRWLFLCFGLVSGTKKWSVQTSNSIQSSVAIGSDGTLYFGSQDKNLYAMDSSSGAVKWKFTTGAPIYASPGIGADGTIYVGSTDGFFYAVDQTGNKVWSFNASATIFASPAIGQDGTLYVISSKGVMHALDNSGKEIWSYQTNIVTAAQSSPVIGVGKSLVWASGSMLIGVRGF